MQDIKLDNADLHVINGDLAVDRSTEQHQELLLIADKGEWKQHPMRGVAVMSYVESSDAATLASAIQTEFTRDGMRVRKIKIELPNITVDADYQD